MCYHRVHRGHQDYEGWEVREAADRCPEPLLAAQLSGFWKPLMTDNVLFWMMTVFRRNKVFFTVNILYLQGWYIVFVFDRKIFLADGVLFKTLMVSRQTILFEIIKINLLIDLNRYEEDYSDLGRDPDLNDMRINPSTFSLHSLRRFLSLSITFLLLIIDIFIIIIFPLLLNHFVRH